MLIRSAGLDDAEGMVPLLEQLGYAADAASIRRRLEVLLRREDCSVFVAEHESQLVGLASVQLLAVLHTDATRAMLTALVVSEAVRGRGIGRALVSRVEEEARGRGCARVFLTSGRHRAGAHHFYERLGYEFTGRRYAKELA